jgi:hypothetical protein
MRAVAGDFLLGFYGERVSDVKQPVANPQFPPGKIPSQHGKFGGDVFKGVRGIVLSRHDISS